MKHIQLRLVAATAIAFSTLCTAGAAFGQYVWLDEKGVRQYSDMPPPVSIPSSRILKQPGGRSSESVADAPTSPTPQTARTELTTAERNAEFRKRKAEQAEKEKKAAEEALAATEKAKNCERARDYLRALESGERIARTERNGERAFLSDDQRQQETKETRRILQDCR